MSDSDDDDIPVRNFVEEDNYECRDDLQIEKAREIMYDFNNKDANREGQQELKIMREYLEVEKKKISGFKQERIAA